MSKKEQRRYQVEGDTLTAKPEHGVFVRVSSQVDGNFGGSIAPALIRAPVLPTERAAAVLGGVGAAAGEGAGAGPSEGGRVSVCPQRDARQDPGHGEGG